MARPRRVTDEQMLEATRRAVGDHGAQVSLDVVAQQLGVTSPALIKRFGSRQSLLMAALCPDERDLDAVFLVPIDERPFIEQLESLIDRLSQYFMVTLPRAMALRECGVSDAFIHQRIKVPMPVRAVAGVTRWLEEMNERGIIESDVTSTAATAIVGAVSTRMVSAYLSKRAWPRRSQLQYQCELAGLFDRALQSAAVPKRPRRKKRRRT